MGSARQGAKSGTRREGNMELFDQHGNPVLCAAEKTNDWTVEKAEKGYGTLLKCNGKCKNIVRYFWEMPDGNVLKTY
jgi:hypothetical protein